MLSFTDKGITFLILDRGNQQRFRPVSRSDDSDNDDREDDAVEEDLNMILEEKVMKKRKLHRC
jgi:hypothetical protein